MVVVKSKGEVAHHDFILKPVRGQAILAHRTANVQWPSRRSVLKQLLTVPGK